MTEPADEGLLIATTTISIPLAEFSFHIARSGGPGGQNVNKLNTKVQLRWNVGRSTALPDDVKSRLLERVSSRLTVDGDLLISRQAHRTQLKNKRACLDALAELIAAAAQPPKRRKKTRPSRASKERRLQAKSERAQKKQRRQKPDW